MLNLSELTLYYINVTFQPELQKIIYTSFSLLENFGNKFYEDKYIELIQREDSITSDTKRDSFILNLQEDIKNIITEHSITINKESNITLNELNEISSFLYIIQNLEDYSLITYRLYAEDLSRHILIDLIDYLTLLEKPRLFELIESVDDNLINSLQNYISDKQDTQDNIDNKHLKYIRDFFSFIENTDCLGLRYFNKGYINITLNDFNNFNDELTQNYIDNIIVTNSGQAGLDILSILILCKDSYELPLLKFKQNTSIFTNQLENVTKLESIIINILNDYNMFLDAKKQEENLNAN